MRGGANRRVSRGPPDQGAAERGAGAGAAESPISPAMRRSASTRLAVEGWV